VRGPLPHSCILGMGFFLNGYFLCSFSLGPRFLWAHVVSAQVVAVRAILTLYRSLDEHLLKALSHG
jgi:hypothetical protein